MKRGAALILLLLAGTAAAAEPAAKCGDQLLAARGLLAADQRAKSPSKSSIARAREAWSQVAPACRTGLWYVTAANLLRHPGSKQPLVAGESTFVTPRDALEAGLRACPRDPALLAYLAYLSRALPAISPPLPASACADLESAGAAERDYVCGVQAATAGDWKQAAARLQAARGARIPDLETLLATARARAKLPKLKPRPPPALACDPFCPMELWRGR